jgi:hypothetical protein
MAATSFLKKTETSSWKEQTANPKYTYDKEEKKTEAHTCWHYNII